MDVKSNIPPLDKAEKELEMKKLIENLNKALKPAELCGDTTKNKIEKLID